MPAGKSVKHDGEIIQFIRSLRKYSQTGADKNMRISQLAYAKWEQIELIPEDRKFDILKALNSSLQEFEAIKDLLYPSEKPE